MNMRRGMFVGSTLIGVKATDSKQQIQSDRCRCTATKIIFLTVKLGDTHEIYN